MPFVLFCPGQVDSVPTALAGSMAQTDEPELPGQQAISSISVFDTISNCSSHIFVINIGSCPRVYMFRHPALAYVESASYTSDLHLKLYPLTQFTFPLSNCQKAYGRPVGPAGFQEISSTRPWLQPTDPADNGSRPAH